MLLRNFLDDHAKDDDERVWMWDLLQTMHFEGQTELLSQAVLIRRNEL